MTIDSSSVNLLEMTTRIVVAAIETGNVLPASIPALIDSVFRALDATMAPQEPVILVPAVSIKRSITPDYIVSLENGQKFKSMRAHLRKLGMTPAEYRKKWGLAPDYPVVAPNYAARRSAMARSAGLGTGQKARKQG